MTRQEMIILALLLAGLVLVLWLLWGWFRSQLRRSGVPQDAYTQALSALIEGDRRAALVYFKEAVQANSENIDAYIRLGDLLRDSGEPKKALALHRDLTVRSHLSAANRVRILESLTRDHLALGRFEESGQSAERLRGLDRQNRFAYRALQQVSEALQDWPRAIKVVEERARLEGESDKTMLARYRGFVGQQELAAENPAEARRHFEQALKLDPECTLASYFLGDLDQAEGKVDNALEHWKAFAIKAPVHAQWVFDRMERAYFEQGRFGDVVPFYRELLHRTPVEHAAPALLALAEIHRRKGDFDEAEAFVQEALEIEPDNPRAHRHLIKLSLDRKDPKQALSHLDRLLSEQKDAVRPGDCRHCGGRLDEPTWRCPDCSGLDPLGV